MTALEAFNALDNREVSRKEVEQVLTQAKAENNTAIIYRLSRVLNDSPEATHFEITITHYDSSVGLSGVQHTGDYREALDDCGRLRKGWKFVKGNVVKVEEKPKKEAKPKKEKAPQKDTKKDKKYKFVVITDDRHSRVIAVFSYTNPNIEELSEHFWKNSEGKYYETTEEGLRNYTFGIGFYPFEKAKKHIEKKYTEGKDFIYFRSEKDGDRDEAISLVEKPKKEAKAKKEKAPQKVETTKEVSDPKVKDFEAFDDLQAQLLAKNADIPESEVLDFLYNFTDAFEEGKTVFRFWNTPGKKPTEAVLQYKKHPLLTRLQNPSAKMRAYELTPRGYELLEKFHKGVERIKKTYDLGYIAGIHKLYNFLRDRKANVKKKENVQDSSKKKVEKAPNKAIKSLKSRKEKGENVANFTLLQEPTKVFLEKEGEQKELDLYMQEMKRAIKESKAGKFDKKNILSWLSKFPDKVKGLLYNFLYHHYLLDQEEAKLRKSKKLVPFGLISVQAGISEFVSKLMDLEREDFFDLYFFFRDNMDECIELLEDKEVKKNYYEKKKKGLSGVDYSQGLFGDIGLNAPRHEGILKEALNECGRLKKGWKFEKGKAVKIDTKTNKEKGTKESREKIKIIPPYIGDIEYNEEGDNYIALEKELGDIMGAKFDQWQKEIIAHNREKKLEMYSKEIWKKIDAEKDTKEDVYVGDYEPDEKGFYYEIRQIGKKKYRLELSVHRYGRFSVYPTAIEDFKSLKQCGDFLIKTLDKSNGFYYTNMLGLSQLQNKINELKGYQYSKQIHFEDKDEGLTGAVPEVSTEKFKKMSVPELREYTLEYYLENYGGKSLSKKFFKEEDIHIEFFNTAGKKLQKPIYKEKVAVLEHLESLIKNSTYNNWGNRKESSPPNIIGYLNFKAKVTIDGEKRHVRISIAVDRDRKFRFKTLEVGANPKKKKQATSIPAPWVTESLRDSSLSEDKGTKKSLSRKKKDENFGLKATEAPVTSLTVPRQTLAQQLAKSPEVRESFLVADEQMSLFLGALEKKTKDSLVITLTGKQGSGKTRFAFQFMNALAQRYRVGHASIEEHPESVLYEEKAYQYLNDTALEHITAQDVRSLAELDTMIHTNEVIVIDSFQKMRELAPHFEIDKDLRKKYDGKLFLVIFQQTADGKMRGGSKSQFDGDIILFTETFPDYRENYVYPDKNRYNKRPATELQYSIYEQRMLATAPEVSALPAHYEPTESEELNFEVL